MFSKFIISSLCVEAYFIANYYLSNTNLNNMQILLKEINTTAVAEGFYAFTYNAER